MFLHSPQGDDSSLAATALSAKLDKKRRYLWSEASILYILVVKYEVF